MRTFTFWSAHWIVCGILIIGVAGCGRKTGPDRFAIRGEVTLDNQPLSAGRISFIPVGDTKGPAAVTTIKDGIYLFDRKNGPVVGKNRVEIESIVDPGFELDDEAAYARAVNEGRGKPVLPAEVIAAEFNKHSKLEAEIGRDGKVQHDFDLKRSLVAQRR